MSLIFWLLPTGSPMRRWSSTAFTPAAGRKGDETLWTIMNRNQYNVDGRQMRLPAQAGMRYYDLWKGHGTDARSAREVRSS